MSKVRSKRLIVRIRELERIYGIYNGGKGAIRYVQLPNNSDALKTQGQLASDMNMDVRTLRNYKLLSDMIPELEELVDTGIVTKTTALAIMKNLSQSV